MSQQCDGANEPALMIQLYIQASFIYISQYTIELDAQKAGLYDTYIYN